MQEIKRTSRKKKPIQRVKRPKKPTNYSYPRESFRKLDFAIPRGFNLSEQGKKGWKRDYFPCAVAQTKVITNIEPAFVQRIFTVYWESPHGKDLPLEKLPSMTYDFKLLSDLARNYQRGNDLTDLNYPALGKDFGPVFLALLSLAKQNHTNRLIFRPEVIAEMIGYKEEWRQMQHIRQVILSLATYNYLGVWPSPKGFAAFAGHIGSCAMADTKNALKFGAGNLQPGEIYFKVDDDWLEVEMPYFAMSAEHLPAFKDWPQWERNGYLFLNENREYLYGRYKATIGRFLVSGFKLTKEQIQTWRKHSWTTMNFKKFLEDMHAEGILKGANFASPVEEVPLREFDQIRILDWSQRHKVETLYFSFVPAEKFLKTHGHFIKPTEEEAQKLSLVVHSMEVY